MSFYNFKLNDPSAGVTSSSADAKSPGRFVHKTFADYRAKSQGVAVPRQTVSKTVMTNDGRGKFSVQGWKEQGVIAPGGEKSRFRLEKQPQQVTEIPVDSPHAEVVEEFPDTLVAVSINASLQGITHTYSPLNIATLQSLGSPTSIRLVKLSGQGVWHSHDHTDEIFIVLRGAIDMLYHNRAGEESVTRVIGGELLRVPMRMEHCVVADDNTEVILLEGKDDVSGF